LSFAQGIGSKKLGVPTQRHTIYATLVRLGSIDDISAACRTDFNDGSVANDRRDPFTIGAVSNGHARGIGASSFDLWLDGKRRQLGQAHPVRQACAFLKAGE